jgi:hypothetical protein
VTPHESSLAAFHSILAAPELSQLVDSIKLTTSLDPYKRTNGFGGIKEESDFIGELEAVITSINKFPNLRDVEVEFTQICSADDGKIIGRSLLKKFLCSGQRFSRRC